MVATAVDCAPTPSERPTPSPHSITRGDYTSKHTHSSFPTSIPSYQRTPSESSFSSSPSPSPSKRSSLSLHPSLSPPHPSPLIPSTFPTSVSAPPTTTHSRFPLLPRSFSSAQGPRPRVQREAEAPFPPAPDSTEEGVERMQREEGRRREEEEGREEKEKEGRLLAGVHRAARLRLQAAAVERNRRVKDDERDMTDLIAQVQQREEQQRRQERERTRTVLNISSTSTADRWDSGGWAEEQPEEKRDRRKPRNLDRGADHRPHDRRTSHSPPAAAADLRQSASSSTSSPSPAPLPPSIPRRSLRPPPADLGLPSNPSYYPSHVHSLLSTTFLPPLSRLFKAYHSRSPTPAPLPHLPLANPHLCLSSPDFLLLLTDLSLIPSLLPKALALRIYVHAVATRRKGGGGGREVGEGGGVEEGGGGLGLGRFLKAMWVVARVVGGGAGGAGGAEEELRVMLVLLEYVRHHCMGDGGAGRQLRLQWPELTLKQAVAHHLQAAASPEAPLRQPPRRRKEERSRALPRDPLPPTTSAAAPTPSSPAPPPPPPGVIASTEEELERERKERKRLRLKEKVERYRREVEAKERERAEEERRRREEEEVREAERRRREERVREEERRRIAQFKARRREEVEEVARAEAERAEREERERRRALEGYVRQRRERKAREEEEQRRRLLSFHAALERERAPEGGEEGALGEAVQRTVGDDEEEQQRRRRKQWKVAQLQRSETAEEAAPAESSTARSTTSATTSLSVGSLEGATAQGEGGRVSRAADDAHSRPSTCETGSASSAGDSSVGLRAS